jgi:hypothetical protein
LNTLQTAREIAIQKSGISMPRKRTTLKFMHDSG